MTNKLWPILWIELRKKSEGPYERSSVVEFNRILVNISPKEGKELSIYETRVWKYRDITVLQIRGEMIGSGADPSSISGNHQNEVWKEWWPNYPLKAFCLKYRYRTLLSSCQYFIKIEDGIQKSMHMIRPKQIETN